MSDSLLSWTILQTKVGIVFITIQTSLWNHDMLKALVRYFDFATENSLD